MNPNSDMLILATLQLPTWLCYYVVCAVYVFVFTLVLMLSFGSLASLFDEYVRFKKLKECWYFYRIAKRDQTLAFHSLIPVMKEFRDADLYNFYWTVYAALGDDSIDFLAWAKCVYGENYEEALRAREAKGIEPNG